MGLRLATAALVAAFFLLAGFALGQTGGLPPDPSAAPHSGKIERPADANMTTGTMDNASAKGRGAAERRPSIAITQ